MNGAISAHPPSQIKEVGSRLLGAVVTSALLLCSKPQMRRILKKELSKVVLEIQTERRITSSCRVRHRLRPVESQSLLKL